MRDDAVLRRALPLGRGLGRYSWRKLAAQDRAGWRKVACGLCCMTARVK